MTVGAKERRQRWPFRGWPGGLSARLLGLTALFVMLAELMILGPSLSPLSLYLPCNNSNRWRKKRSICSWFLLWPVPGFRGQNRHGYRIVRPRWVACPPTVVE